MDPLKTDCRHFRPDRPCAPHKQHGVVCAVLVNGVRALGDRQPRLLNILFADRCLIIVRHLAEVIVESADHDHGETFSGLHVL